MKKSVVYLIESSKGIVSILSHSAAADIKIAVFFGQLVPPDIGNVDEFQIILCKSIKPEDVYSASRQIEMLVKDTELNLITTDDTFNLMSFEIYNSLRHLKPIMKLLDHLKATGLSYRRQFSVLSYIRYRKAFIRHPLRFLPIEFSNKVAGYKIKIQFNEVEYLKDLSPLSLINLNDHIEILVLIPLLDDEESKLFVQYFDRLFASWFATVNNINEKIAVKLHPRAGVTEREFLTGSNFLSKCIQLTSSTPLELYDLSDKLVINFQSSFSVQKDVEVILLARHFGYSKVHSSNMTGHTDLNLREIEAKIFMRLQKISSKKWKK